MEAAMLEAYNVEMPSSSEQSSPPVDRRTELELMQEIRSNSGAQIVTSTVRAARSLRHHYDQWQHASGNTGWVTPQIFAWDAWIEMLWNATVLAGAERRILLTEVQELELWRALLTQDEAAKHTLSIDSLAELAQQAWRQMHRFGISPRRLRGESGLDAKAFSNWCTEFEKVCRKADFLSPAMVEVALAASVSRPSIQLPQELLLVGFDRMTASQASLIDAVGAHGCVVREIEILPTQAVPSNRAIVSAATLDEEIASAAKWAHARLIAGPTQRIGVIVTGLEDLRNKIDGTFRRTLAPSSMDVCPPEAPLPYEFSLGTPINRLAPVRTALTLLRWLHDGISGEDISWLIVHGDFGDRSDEAKDVRARLDRAFRERMFSLGGAVSIAAFSRWFLQARNLPQSASLRRAIEHFPQSAKRYGTDKARSFGDWRELIEEFLEAVSWGLLKARTSIDYQILRRWNTLLDDLGSLNGVAGEVRFSIALSKLEQLSAKTLFTLETQNAPVQILGVSESAGLVFDAIWWMNVRAGTWPSRGSVQPFLPWSLQREAHMPYADPQTDYAFALRTTRRILDSAPIIVSSFAIQESDPATSSTHVPDPEIALSPLLREALPGTPIILDGKLTAESPARNTNAGNAYVFEDVHEEAPVPFRGTELRNGVRFLELHAACPFRAFAEMRLGADPLTEADSGLSRANQGTILHKVLDGFWKEVQSSENLLHTSTMQHREILRRYIDSALADYLNNASESWQQTLLKIEADRLEKRLLEWLDVEKKRPAFSVLNTEETLESANLADIRFRCRIDRIDRVEQGIVLLDYKTGRVERNACGGERPDQPQLPAYAVLREQTSRGTEPLAGVAFAGLHPQKVDFTIVASLAGVLDKPLEADAEDAPSNKRSKAKHNPAALNAVEMRTQQEEWAESLRRLSEEFRAGAAIIDPKYGNTTCQHCEQALLCRVRETASAFSGNTEEQDYEMPQSIGNVEP